MADTRLYCSNLQCNESSTRQQARTKDGKLRSSIFYPKAFKGYVSLIFDDVIQLRSQYPTFKKASTYSKSVLPPEPSSLVERYNKGKERPRWDEVIANHHTCFSKPALPEERGSAQSISCSCKGKCATKACPFKYNNRQEGCSSGPEQQLNRFHKFFVCRSQKRWRESPGSELETAKPIFSVRALQDGGDSHVKRPPKGMALSSKDRPQRCLLDSFNLERSPEVLALSMERYNARVCMPSLWTGHSSQGLHKIGETCSGHVETGGCD
ncbi:Hypothetical predicted protein [Paramuricea clavata]|uniref:Uncharacterized protein n=1 Tax=Paramuricea clavata TaxID=317549 RepID=A0A6S7I8V4_PARCT|nr:Hypothetical predicted protein [Paramuricea clavata]